MFHQNKNVNKNPICYVDRILYFRARSIFVTWSFSVWRKICCTFVSSYMLLELALAPIPPFQLNSICFLPFFHDTLLCIKMDNMNTKRTYVSRLYLIFFIDTSLLSSEYFCLLNTYVFFPFIYYLFCFFFFFIFDFLIFFLFLVFSVSQFGSTSAPR